MSDQGGWGRLTSMMPLPIGPSSQSRKVSSRNSRVRALLRSFGWSFSTADMTHCTLVLFSKTSCMMKAPLPAHPYCLSCSKNSAPSVSRAFSNGTRFLQSQKPAGEAPSASAAPCKTCRLTAPKIPSAPMTALKVSSCPSRKVTLTAPSASATWVISESALFAWSLLVGRGARSSRRSEARCTTLPASSGSPPPRSIMTVPACLPDPCESSLESRRDTPIQLCCLSLSQYTTA